MKILRTADERFAGLAGFAFEPRYVEVGDGLRVHYLDEGPAGAAPVLLLHGEPSWCYLYRTMIPVLAAAGHRCIAPDLIGFGRSDKPAEPGRLQLSRHVDWMAEVIFDRLGLTGITLVGQDWGGLIGLRLVAAKPDRFARVVAANTRFPPATSRWARHSCAGSASHGESPVLDIGRIVSSGTVSELPRRCHRRLRRAVPR